MKIEVKFTMPSIAVPNAGKQKYVMIHYKWERIKEHKIDQCEVPIFLTN